MPTKFRNTLGIVLAAAALCAQPAADATTKTVRKLLSEKQAIALVAKRPEVKKWKKAVLDASKSRGVSAHIELDRKEKGEFVIHVYELVPDDPKTSHTATFNWYHVNQRSGKVMKEF